MKKRGGGEETLKMLGTEKILGICGLENRYCEFGEVWSDQVRSRGGPRS